jgi:hypothetical protein
VEQRLCEIVAHGRSFGIACAAPHLPAGILSP